MPRLLFEKTGNAVWMSHLDLMRMFQRAFKRAGLPLTHTQGFNPRPSVSIALPLSVGVESRCELLDFDLEGESIPYEEICQRLNHALVAGVKVLEVYPQGKKIGQLALLQCQLELEYDAGVSAKAEEQIKELFQREEIIVEKRTKNGMVEQNIVPMIRRLELSHKDNNTLLISALICCQNPTLNPAQMAIAIEKYLPEQKPDFYQCKRLEVYDANELIFR